MIGEEAFRIWSRSDADPHGNGPAWSRWTKPVLFVEMNEADPLSDPSPPAGTPHPGPPWTPEADPQQAVIVDVPGEEAVDYGVHLARLGYWPVPLFNACPAPRHVTRISVAIDVRPVMKALLRGAGQLQAVTTHPQSPPAFLLDSRRTKRRKVAPGEFDNRWVVLPQDLPSASYLSSWDIRRVLLIQQAGAQPQEDLAHVLRRWQEAGIGVLVKQLSVDASPQQTEVTKPSWFRSVWLTAAVLLGLHRNSTGGFGEMVPVPSQSHGHFG